jgi:hypothetical protein
VHPRLGIPINLAMNATENIVQQLKLLIPRLVLREFLLFPSEIATRQLFAELVVCNALKFAESADNRKFLTISYTEVRRILVPTSRFAVCLIIDLCRKSPLAPQSAANRSEFWYVLDSSGTRRTRSSNCRVKTSPQALSPF